MNVRLLAFCAFVAVVYASSHSEAPGSAKTPASDLTDFYMFQCYEAGKEDHTCFVVNAQGLQHPYAGPNYFTLSDSHFFEIYIDNNGDASEDITFQFMVGSELAGPLIEVPFKEDEQDCSIYQRTAAPRPLTEMKHGGLELMIGGQSVAVPLKFIGPITQVNDPNLNWNEYYSVSIIRGDRTFGVKETLTDATNATNTRFVKPFDYAGTKTFPNYAAYAQQHYYTVNIPGCTGTGRVFVGQRAEAFYISLGPIFDLINLLPIPGFPGSVTEDPAHNDLRNDNIDSFVLEVPTSCLTIPAQDGVIGAWAGVRKLIHSGDEHIAGAQTNRLGAPLVNELIIGLRDKNNFNKQEPRMDGVFLTYVQYPTLPAIIDILFRDGVNALTNSNFANIAPTNLPRTDLVTAFLTGVPGVNQPINVTASEMLRLNTTIPPVSQNAQSRFGVLGGDLAGFPNGRRPGDDVVDIALRVVMGALCHADLGLCQPSDAVVGDQPFTDGSPLSANDLDATFPYLRTPYPGSTGI